MSIQQRIPALIGSMLLSLIAILFFTIEHAYADTCVLLDPNGSGACLKWVPDPVTPPILNSATQGRTCIAYATDGSGVCVSYADPTVVPSILQSGQGGNGGPSNVTAPTNFKSLVALITGILKTLVILVFALTFLVFMWGIIKGWIIGGDSAEGVESGKKVMTTGIIVLVIMVSVWGILSLLQSSFFK